MIKDYRKYVQGSRLARAHPLALPHTFVPDMAKEEQADRDLEAFFRKANKDEPFAFTSPRRPSYTKERLDSFTDAELCELKDFLFGPKGRS
jgi:hypothetical protein